MNRKSPDQLYYKFQIGQTTRAYNLVMKYRHLYTTRLTREKLSTVMVQKNGVEFNRSYSTYKRSMSPPSLYEISMSWKVPPPRHSARNADRGETWSVVAIGPGDPLHRNRPIVRPTKYAATHRHVHCSTNLRAYLHLYISATRSPHYVVRPPQCKTE